MDFRAGRGRVKSLLIHGGGSYLLSWCYMHIVLIHPPGGPIPSQSQSQLYHHCAWNSVCPSVCTSVLPSVRPFVCLQLQSIQIQKTGKFLFTLSHDDAPHPHHNHLHHLFQNCPSVHIPQLSRKYFLSHFKSAPFQKRAALFSKVLPIYLSFSHHRQPHSSYTCAVWGPTQISKHLPPHPPPPSTPQHTYEKLQIPVTWWWWWSYLLICNPHFLSFRLAVPKKQQSLIGGNGSRS